MSFKAKFFTVFAALGLIMISAMTAPKVLAAVAFMFTVACIAAAGAAVWHVIEADL